MNRNEVEKYRDAAKAVSEAITAWGMLSSGYLGIEQDMWHKFYNPAVEVGMWKVRNITNNCVCFLDDALAEDARSKFDRRAAELQVWESCDFPGMYRATASGDRLMGPYNTKEQALDALEAVFNAEAK